LRRDIEDDEGAVDWSGLEDLNLGYDTESAMKS
jgi:hypothetical protein